MAEPRLADLASQRKEQPAPLRVLEEARQKASNRVGLPTVLLVVMLSVGVSAIISPPLALVMGCIVAYLLPAVVAATRNHSNSSAIMLLNLFFGWTVLGWFGALIWSATDNVRDE